MKLKKLDAGIIFREDGKVELAMPKIKETESVSDNILLATTIVMLITEDNKTFNNLVNKQYKKLLNLLEKVE